MVVLQSLEIELQPRQVLGMTDLPAPIPMWARFTDDDAEQRPHFGRQIARLRHHGECPRRLYERA